MNANVQSWAFILCTIFRIIFVRPFTVVSHLKVMRIKKFSPRGVQEIQSSEIVKHVHTSSAVSHQETRPRKLLRIYYEGRAKLLRSCRVRFNRLSSTAYSSLRTIAKAQVIRFKSEQGIRVISNHKIIEKKKNPTPQSSGLYYLGKLKAFRGTTNEKIIGKKKSAQKLHGLCFSVKL